MSEFDFAYYDELRENLGPVDETELTLSFLERRGFLLHRNGPDLILDHRSAKGFSAGPPDHQGDVEALTGRGFTVSEPQANVGWQLSWPSFGLEARLKSIFTCPGIRSTTAADMFWQNGVPSPPALALDPGIALLIKVLVWLGIHTDFSCSGDGEPGRDLTIQFHSDCDAEKWVSLTNLYQPTDGRTWLKCGIRRGLHWEVSVDDYLHTGRNYRNFWEEIHRLALKIKHDQVHGVLRTEDQVAGGALFYGRPIHNEYLPPHRLGQFWRLLANQNLTFLYWSVPNGLVSAQEEGEFMRFLRGGELYRFAEKQSPFVKTVPAVFVFIRNAQDELALDQAKHKESLERVNALL